VAKKDRSLLKTVRMVLNRDEILSNFWGFFVISPNYVDVKIFQAISKSISARVFFPLNKIPSDRKKNEEGYLLKLILSFFFVFFKVWRSIKVQIKHIFDFREFSLDFSWWNHLRFFPKVNRDIIYMRALKGKFETERLIKRIQRNLTQKIFFSINKKFAGQFPSNKKISVGKSRPWNLAFSGQCAWEIFRPLLLRFRGENLDLRNVNWIKLTFQYIWRQKLFSWVPSWFHNMRRIHSLKLLKFTHKL